MPRDGSNIYHVPAGTAGTPNTAIESAKYNSFLSDLENDLNLPRPIVAGGTGAATADAAMTALGGERSGQIVTNYDSHVFLPGSFYSDAAATNPPVSAHAFVGICAFVDANNMFLEAYDRDDSSSPGAAWLRQKKAGVWGSWARAVPPASLTISGTPAAFQIGSWASASAIKGVAITGLIKGRFGTSQDPVAAIAGVDYLAPPSGTSILKANSGGALTNASAGSDYLAPPAGTSILKANSGGALANATVGSDYGGPVANPTGTIGLTAVNGSLTTTMRSDGAPALSQAIIPTWTGAHVWSSTTTFNGASTHNAQTNFEGQAVSPLQTLTDAATISGWDMANGQKAKVTLGAAGRTMGAPTNIVEGTTYFLWVLQDATGNRTITTWNSVFDFGASGAPTLTTTGSRGDLLTFEAINIASLKLRYTGIAKGFA